MRTLYLECSMGAAGDMLTAALLELLPDRQVFLDKMNALGLDGVTVTAETRQQIGITGTQMHVVIHGEEEESLDVHEHGHHHDHPHDHEQHHDDHHHNHHHDGAHHENEHHDHEHHHEHGHHHHASVQDITEKIQSLPVSDFVQQHALAVYQLIAEAESHAHGKPVSEIHFHEVGAKDAIADIVGVCMLIEMLHPDRIMASPVHVGSGYVRCAHGILPVPAPATAHILQGVPCFGGSVEGELCTPTGAALLRHFADAFVPMPLMQTEKIGYGFGKKEFERLNAVRAFLGETQEAPSQIVELICNVDDMTGEELGFAQEGLLSAGAREVFTVPVTMKKSRPGVMLVCLCTENQRQEMLHLIFQHTTTIGVRMHLCERFTLDRSVSEQNTVYGAVRTKTVHGFGVTRTKPEYDDLARIAKEHGLSLREVRAELEKEGS